MAFIPGDMPTQHDLAAREARSGRWTNKQTRADPYITHTHAKQVFNLKLTDYRDSQVSIYHFGVSGKEELK